MASVSSDQGGRRRIMFVAPDGRRKSIRLGDMAIKQAEAVKMKVEAILSARLAGLPLDAESARWVGTIGGDLADKLAAAGLVPERTPAAPSTLGNFLADFITKRAGAKPRTRTNLKQAAEKLLDHFGSATPIDRITPPGPPTTGWWRSGYTAPRPTSPGW